MSQQAFPSLSVFTDRDGEVCSQSIEGMSLRDYFAAKAMQSAIVGANLGGMPGKDERASELSAMLAECAYAIADAMLKARGQ